MSELASRRQDIRWGKNGLYGKGNPNFHGGQYVDDKGYLRVLRVDHPFNNKGYIYMHRLVMEKYLGRFLQPWETIHHINEIKLDNRVDNLFLTTVPEHSSIHRAGKKVSLARKSALRKKIRQKRKAGQGRTRNVAGRFVKSDET